MLAQVAKALGVNESAGKDLQAYLASKELLLVIDNVEQVVEAAGDLARLLAAAPSLRLLATSREALHVAAERVYPVPPLGLPDPLGSCLAADVARCDAVALFAERARAVDPSFEINAANAATIAAICTRLDGLPLALELAAARAGSLSPGAILARLNEPLKLLKGGHRDSPERHRALERTLAWSFDLLGADEQRLFARLGMFAGGFSLEAAESVCDADLDTVGSLVDKSLARRDGERYAMLETIRGYALDQLKLSGEEPALHDRHAAFFEQLVATAYAEPVSRRAARAGELECEHDASYGTWTLLGGWCHVGLAGYEDLDGLKPFGNAGPPFPPPYGWVLKNRDVVEEDAEQFSLEARLASPADSTLQWVAGLYYFTEEVSREESFLTQFSLLPIAGGDVTFFQDVDSMTYAVFGQATYPFTDRLSATLSLRYSHDDKEADQLAINNDPTDATPGIPLLPGQPYDIKADDSWDATTGRFALDYRKDAGQLLYASVSKGFKSGIFPSQNNVVQNVGEATPPEEVWSYEIGAKTEWFEETLRVNLAIFCMDYQDLQLFRLNPRLVLVTFTENTVNTGAELPRAPEFTFGGFAQYSWPLAGGNMALRADFKWTDDYRTEIAYTTSPSTATSPASDAANARITTIKSFALLDARLSYAPGERNLEFSPWGKNLTDETYPTHIIPFLGNGFSIFAPPRTYGVSARRRTR